MSAELSESLAGNYGFADVIIWRPRPATPSILIFESPLFPTCLNSPFGMLIWRGVLWRTCNRLWVVVQYRT